LRLRRSLTFAFALGLAGPALAQAPCLAKDALSRAAIAAGGIALYEGSELAKAKLAGDEPRWVDANLNPLDRLGEKMRWSPVGLDEGAETLSDITLSVAVLSSGLVAFAPESRGLCLVEDVSAMAEAVVVAGLLNQAVKFLARRQRPFADELSPEEREEICQRPGKCVDLNLSFYSGHSTLTFSTAVAAGTIALRRGYGSATAAYVFGLSGAALTAYLRVAAGKHYLSDVLLGSALGVAAGFIVPSFVHPIRAAGGEVALSPLGPAPGLYLSGSF
jgi:membrane-associated phospholipid phosphatase